MALYAMGDLHLSLNSDKSMDIFGDGWHDYVNRIREGFAPLCDDDVTVLCGDLSWGMSLEESLLDFQFINALPGKKILLKGNHDYWWNTASKMKRFFAENGLDTMEILHNNCLFYGEREKLCFLHYPPIYQGYECPEILRLLKEYGVKACYYGHLHGASHRRAIEGTRNGTLFSLVAGDFLGFVPKKICE